MSKHNSKESYPAREVRENDTNDTETETSQNWKNQEVERRRQIILELRIKGYSKSEIIDGLKTQGVKVSPATLSRDIAAIKKQNTDSLKGAVGAFDVHSYAQERLKALDIETKRLWELIDSTIKDTAKVAAMKHLQELRKERQQIFVDLGVRLHLISEEEQEDNTLIIHRPHSIGKLVLHTRPDGTVTHSIEQDDEEYVQERFLIDGKPITGKVTIKKLYDKKDLLSSD